MSNDWSDDPGGNNDFGSEQSPWESPNTTDPGEPGAGWQNEPSHDYVPMGPATIGDVFNNFGKVLSRALESGVVWVYAALLATQFVVTIVGLVGVFAMTIGFAGLSNLDSDLAAAGLGTGVFVGVGGVVLVSMALQLLMLGLLTPMKSALFEGPQPHHGFKWAFGKAMENIGSIFLLGLAGVMAMVPGFVLAAVIAEWLMLLWMPVMLVVWIIMAPSLWYAATGHGVVGAVTKAFSVVASNFVLFLLLFLIAFGAGLVLGCVNVVLGIIPIIGMIISWLLGLVVNFLGWVYYVSVFATVDSHEMGRPIY